MKTCEREERRRSNCCRFSCVWENEDFKFLAGGETRDMKKVGEREKEREKCNKCPVNYGWESETREMCCWNRRRWHVCEISRLGDFFFGEQLFFVKRWGNYCARTLYWGRERTSRFFAEFAAPLSTRGH